MIRKTKESLCFLVFSLSLLFVGYFYITYSLKFKKIDLENKVLSEKIENFNQVLGVVNDSSAYPSKLEFKDDKMIIYYNSVEIYNLPNQKGFEYENIVNPSFKSAIFSLGSLRNFLLKNEPNIHEIKLIDLYVKSVIEYSNHYSNSDSYILHDHPVSERLEALLLYVSYKLARDFDVFEYEYDHIKHLLFLLKQNSYYSYYMNHGLIQAKALLRAGIILDDQSMIDKSKEFLNDTYDIYVSSDGSILESASQYQIFVYSIFSEFDELLKGRGDYSYSKVVSLQKDVIHNLVTKDGFLQGFGDSYNVFTNEFDESDLDRTFFSYNNGIAGANLRKDKFSLLFISLDNKPNVHKLPEDLSVYLYYEGPFFINTGTYSYNKNDTYRKYFLEEKSQNGLKFSSDNIISSSVKLASFNDSIINFEGHAISKFKDSIFRDIKLDLVKNNIVIQDSSGNGDLYSNFILHPSVRYELIDSKNIILSNANRTINLTSDKEINVIDKIYSNELFSVKKTKIIQIKGNNNLKFSFNGITHYTKSSTSIVTNDNSKYNLREKTTKKLRSKYSITFNIRKINVTYFCIGIGFMMLFLFVNFLPYKYTKITFCLIVILSILNILFGGELFVTWFYNLNFLLK